MSLGGTGPLSLSLPVGIFMVIAEKSRMECGAGEQILGFGVR